MWRLRGQVHGSAKNLGGARAPPENKRANAQHYKTDRGEFQELAFGKPGHRKVADFAHSVAQSHTEGESETAVSIV